MRIDFFVQAQILRLVAAATGRRYRFSHWIFHGNLANGLALLLPILPFSVFPTQAGTDYVTLKTGGGKSLASDQVVLSADGIASPELTFDFGFSTAEVPAPDSFLDSFTVTIQDATSNTAVLATIDGSGVVWAPTSPGALSLSDSEIQHRPIASPDTLPLLDRSVAFNVQMPLPVQFSGPTQTVTFDLFDNENGTASLGWYRNLKIVSIPEPGVGWELGLGLLLLVVGKNRRP